MALVVAPAKRHGGANLKFEIVYNMYRVKPVDVYGHVGVWKYNGYTGSLAGPARGPAVGAKGSEKREMAAGKGTGRAGRPPLTGK
jgi:hypothetical protein